MPKDRDSSYEINFKDLEEYTLQQQLSRLLDQRQLLPVIVQVIELIAQLRDAFFFEFELASHNLIAIPSATKQNDRRWRCSLVN
jgi:hypothetical protein